MQLSILHDFSSFRWVGGEESSCLLSYVSYFRLDIIVYRKQPCKGHQVCCCLFILRIPLCLYSSPSSVFVSSFSSMPLTFVHFLMLLRVVVLGDVSNEGMVWWERWHTSIRGRFVEGQGEGERC